MDFPSVLFSDHNLSHFSLIAFVLAFIVHACTSVPLSLGNASVTAKVASSKITMGVESVFQKLYRLND
uniref:Transmembrane protein n=1 Tax=Parascaris equorum TaxID=6256 RepID=A0A914RJS3_PAREQ